MNFFNGTIPSGAPSGPDLGLDVASGKLYFTHPGIAGWQTIAAGTPGGSNTQIQFDDGGVFGGDARFTFDKATGFFKLTTLGAGAFSVGLDGSDPSFNAYLQGWNGITFGSFNEVTTANNAGAFGVVVLNRDYRGLQCEQRHW